MSEIEELEKKYDILIKVIQALKNGDLDMERIVLSADGFTVLDTQIGDIIDKIEDGRYNVALSNSED
jgi:hypothetical protein|tara:strand:- start:299 stop:499 length:201 start_codon:yes stop_codon:yes gene_type:complete